MSDYKYKGSEVDRNFSIKNLQRTLQQQQVKQIQQYSSPLYAGNVSQQHQEVHQSTKNNLVNELIKPEVNYQPLPNQFKIKKRKKKSKGLHL